jgi:membrane protease subunit (stomatin/prohibitin family)
MGVMNWLNKQFIDVIECKVQDRELLVWAFPHHDNEIKNGAQLIVREGQVAVFVSEGQIGDVFRPGLYTLTTQNLPILTSLSSWKYKFESPFKCEVYFISTVQHIDMKWGTVKPITLRDPDFGIVRVRAHGVYAIQVDADGAKTFMKELVGTDGRLWRDELEGQIRAELLQSFTAALGGSGVAVLDVQGNVMGIAETCRAAMEPTFSQWGLKLPRFVIASVSMPKEVEKAIDERASMGALGNMQQYTQFQAAKAMREAANQPGGLASAAVGLGAGVMAGGLMAQQAAPALFAGGAPAAPAAQAAPAGPSLEDRLKKLKGLLEQGLIDDATFAKKRDEILSEI